jgi:hypothetical protein
MREQPTNGCERRVSRAAELQEEMAEHAFSFRHL